MIGLQTSMSIPDTRSASTMLHLNKSHSPLNQTTNRQHLSPEFPRFRLVHPVHLLSLLGFRTQLQHLRYRHLHPISQLVRPNPSLQGRIPRILLTPQTIPPLRQPKSQPLLTLTHTRRSLPVIQRIRRINSHRNRIMLRTQIMTVLRVPVLPTTNRYKLRQIVVQ